MKSLILTVSAGQGHIATAKAVKNAFSENGCECKILDICYEVNKLLGILVDKGYLFSVAHLSKLYAKTYTKLLDREVGKSDITTKTAGYLTKKLRDQIIEYSPDVIICTHVFCGMVIKPLVLGGEINSKTVGILTDYTLHPYWEETTFFNQIVIPAKELSDECINKGYKAEQIVSLGIPIQKKFSSHMSKREARAVLGLDPDKTVVSIMSGSMCYGGVTKTVSSLDSLEEDFQIVAICGSDKRELKRLQKTSFKHKVLKFGFTSDVNIIMDASDCIITKPGGISTAEAISRELPMILSKPIPGHEERNLSFLIKEGIALSITKDQSADKVFKRYLTESELRNSMLDSAKRLSKNDAAYKIYELVK